MTNNHISNKERIDKHIDTLAWYNSTPTKGITRFSYTEQDRKAREYLLDKMAELGLQITQDSVGNIRARLEGSYSDAPPVLTGSHIDTVRHGGKYDGVVGVVCALEALTVFKEQSYIPQRPIDLIIFVEEEGVNFGAGLAGSKALVGTYTPETLKTLVNDDGVSMYDGAKSFGLDPDTMGDHLLKPGDAHAMVEVHIEQSVVLDTEKISLGIVTGIAGIEWLRVEIEGQPDHAGAMPMQYRKDPMAGAAEIIATIEETARSGALPTTVATVGKILCSPNVPNVIPEKVHLVVDIRDVDPAGIETVTRMLIQKLEQVASRRNLSYTVKNVSSIGPTTCSEKVVDALEQSAKKRGIAYKYMISGALHDTAVLAGITEVGMLFVPSIHGRSHCPQEYTSIDDIAKGCDVLLGALEKLSKL